MSPPAHIFVVRHGNRLDAADKQWHLSSPTPYDPPLTYSGWTQSRAVGVQIANLLQHQAQEAYVSSAGTSRRKKRFQVVIHTSPFLRCIQTSIAISAGLATRPSLLAEARRNLSPIQMSQLEDASTQTQGKPSRTTRPVGRKTVLRIDAFLGEWLSPSYFELITPPPGSVMMLASAKASLLKVENYHSYPHLQTRTQSNSVSQRTPSGHLWGSASGPGSSGARSSPLSAPPLSALEDAASSTSLDNLGGLKKALPDSRSADSGSPTEENPRPATAPASASTAEAGAYDPPTPAFSISKNAPIPDGYVNHAKDACVVVDYQWDSMRGPYDWGDGGELPEDWPDMHRRFRKGLQAMVDWYSTAESPASAVTSEVVRPGEINPANEKVNDSEDVETVVIVVSHGAGCNAMIGAISHKPALMDVPLSSLTMASLKRNPAGANAHIYQKYDMKMTANTDHLRAPSPPTPRSPAMASVLGASGSGGNYYNHTSQIRSRGTQSFSSGTATSNGLEWNTDGESSPTGGGSLAAIRRGLKRSGSSGSSSTTKPALTPSGLSRTPSLGLWAPSPTLQADEECIDDEEAVLLDLELPSVGNGKRPAESAQEDDEHADEHADQVAQLPRPGALWGPGGRGADIVRDLSSSKRRWTVTERP